MYITGEPLKRFAQYFGVLTVLGAVALPWKLQADETTASFVPGPREIDPAEREKRATRIVTPEALKVLSRYFNTSIPINAFRATVLREHVEAPANRQPQPPLADWTRAEIHLGLGGAIITRYWPRHSESLTADGRAIYIGDSRFPHQYKVVAVTKDEWGNGKWRDKVLQYSDLEWGALGNFESDRDSFAAFLLDKGLVSVVVVEPRDMDGTLCDVVEIRLVNNYGGTSKCHLAVARSDGFARMLDVEDEIPPRGTSVLREKYFHVQSYNPLASPETADESPLFHFVPAKGAKRVTTFAKAK